jgi:hypothetical protein
LYKKDRGRKKLLRKKGWAGEKIAALEIGSGGSVIDPPAPDLGIHRTLE